MKHIGNSHVGSSRRKWLLLLCNVLGILLVSVVATVWVSDSPDLQHQLEAERHHAAPFTQVHWMAVFGALSY